MNSRYQFSYLTKQVITFAVYVIFLVFILKNIINAPDNSTRVFNIIVLLLLGIPAIFYEFLRYNFDSATKKTIFEGRPSEALNQIFLVEKYDILKMFKTSCMMLRMLCLIDTRKFSELKEYVNSVKKEDLNDYDVAILSSYAEMIANGEENARGRMNSAFKEMVTTRDIKDKKGRRSKGAYFFNWNVVYGEHKLYENDYEGSWKYLKQVNESTMNKREAMHYFAKRALVCKQLKMIDDYKTFKERALKAAGQNTEMKNYIETL